MFDSWGKIPTGIFYGNTFDLGNFDQCMTTNLMTGLDSVGNISGHYCLGMLGADIFPKLPELEPEPDDISGRLLFTGLSGYFLPFLSIEWQKVY